MFDKVLASIAPHTCCGCGQIGTVLCEHCNDDIMSEASSSCVECRQQTVTDNLCQTCRKREPWEGAWMVGVRDGVIRKLIDLYKFEGVRAVDSKLARLLDGRLPSLDKDTAVVYIPSTNVHRRQRGYETMKRVAEKFVKIRGYRLAPPLVRQGEYIQRNAGRQQRLAQQEDAFVVQASSTITSLLLIDDVYTTGGTLRAAARALKAAYGCPVYVGVIARQPIDDDSDL